MTEDSLSTHAEADPADAVIAAYLEAMQAGTPPDRAALLAEHPGLADELGAFFADLDRFAALAGPLREAPPGADALATPNPGATLTDIPAAGRAFGDYELLEEVGRGGMGVVYRARQKSLNRTVAVKMILAGEFAAPEDVERFRTEAENAARLDHPNIVPVYEVGEHGGLPYFSMKYIEGACLAERPPAGADALAGVMAQVARAVYHAHQRRILHRDLKPGNILIDAAGQPHVTDFGLAKHVGDATAQTLSGAIVGTPGYMAPEQAAGHNKRLTTVCDVYGLGAVLYELLAGRPPFRGETALETLQLVLTQEPAPPSRLRPGVPRDLEVICLKCLRKEPEKRYDSALALAEDLERFGSGEAIRARAAGPAERAARWVRRHPARAALAAVSALAALALVGVGVGQWYNGRLEASNKALEESNAQLTAAKAELETSNQKIKAEQAKARRYFYDSQMTLVEQARRDKQDGRVVQLLRTSIPDDPEEEDPRRWEWHHLWREYHGEQSRLRGHKGAVTAVACSPDDRLIASGSADNTVKFWDAATGKELRTLTGHEARVTGVAFSPDGKRLATSSADRTVRIWDTATGKELLCFKKHAGAVTSLAFSPDGKHVASGSEDTTVRIWGADTGDVMREFKGHRRPVMAVAYSPDANTVASIGQGPKGEFIVWGASTGDIDVNNTGMAWTSVAFSPDGRQLATGEVGTVGRDDKNDPVLKVAVRIWDLCTLKGPEGGHVKAFEGHQDAITQVVFSPDGKQLVSSGVDQTVRLWDVSTGKEVVTFHEEAAALCAAFSPDGQRVVSGSADHTVKLWTPPGNAVRTIKTEKSRINNVEFSRDGRRLAAAAGDTFFTFEVLSGKEFRSFGRVGGYGRVAWSPDGRRIALGENLEVWDEATGAITEPALDPTIVHPHGMLGAAFSRDGKLLAAVSGSGQAVVWDTTTGRRLHALPAVNYPSCVVFSADGQRLAVGSAVQFRLEPEALRVWDLATGQVCLAPEGFLPGVQGVAFSPDGRWLAAAVGSYDGKSPGVSPGVGGRRGEVRVWDATTGQQVYNLRGHSGCVWGVAFSPDGKRLASAGGKSLLTSAPGKSRKREPGEVKIWDMQTGQEVCTLRAHSACVFGVSFSPDGRRLATAGEDGTVKIYDGTPLASAPDPDHG
jgi:WD40 repeat protein